MTNRGKNKRECMEAHLIQGSEDWLQWRKDKVCASDTPAITGTSPYSTALQLWEVKTGRRQPTPMSPHMQYGHNMEPEIRASYEEEVGECFLPQVVTNPAIPWMAASLDGMNLKGTKILEIKCCNRKVFDEAKAGEVVPHYYDQIMHQLACCPIAEEVHYVCYNSGEMVSVIVKRDENHIEKIIEACKAFYFCMTNDVPPAVTEKDYIEIDSYEFCNAAAQYIEAKKRLDAAKAQEATCKSALLDQTDDGNCKGGGLKLTMCEKQTIDYKQACIDAGIDITKYAKTPSSYWKITVTNE